ncbi:MAG: energy transducer TonB [Mailhella sp.]|nr:energy transducer TonB [Mailhella sp.]
MRDVPFGRACGPAFTRFIRPSYPLQARRAGISGLVKLRVSLDGEGIVRDIEVLESGHRLLAEAACTAVRRSEFRPYTENGKSLPSRTVIPIRFSLEQAR